MPAATGGRSSRRRSTPTTRRRCSGSRSSRWKRGSGSSRRTRRSTCGGFTRRAPAKRRAGHEGGLQRRPRPAGAARLRSQEAREYVVRALSYSWSAGGGEHALRLVPVEGTGGKPFLFGAGERRIHVEVRR